MLTKCIVLPDIREISHISVLFDIILYIVICVFTSHLFQAQITHRNTFFFIFYLIYVTLPLETQHTNFQIDFTYRGVKKVLQN